MTNAFFYMVGGKSILFVQTDSIDAGRDSLKRAFPDEKVIFLAAFMDAKMGEEYMREKYPSFVA